MRNSLLFKCLVIGLLILAIMIPLGMIQSTVAERQSFHQQAVASVEQSFAGAQTFVGPVVVVPWIAEVPITDNDANGVPHQQLKTERGQWTFFPKTVSMDGSLLPEFKHRGIHQVLTYAMSTGLKGHFDIVLPVDVPGATLRAVGKPCLSFGIGDVRGLIGTPTLLLDGRPAALLQGVGGERTASGMHSDLPAIAAGQARSFDVAMAFTLGGTERIAIAPVGDSNRIELKSPWTGPDFEGRFSPHQLQISSKGFDATWDISALAANTQGQYLDGGMKDGADEIEVNLVDPVNIYVKADRATKYGLLFVLLTFVGFFMFELIKQLRIHPIQYLLVGLAIAIFFLLLVSLSEHYEFVWSYIGASAACIGLQGFYLSYVLRSRLRGIGFAAMLTVLYGALYGLLGSEDNALVLGSLMLFAILAAIMIVTRKIDWYRVAQPPLAESDDAVDPESARA